jgi:hypothetical protein
MHAVDSDLICVLIQFDTIYSISQLTRSFPTSMYLSRKPSEIPHISRIKGLRIHFILTTTMATNKKAKHAITAAITASSEHPAAIPEHLPTSKLNGEHPQPVPVTPERSNRTSVTGKHPRNVTETERDIHKTSTLTIHRFRY